MSFLRPRRGGQGMPGIGRIPPLFDRVSIAASERLACTPSQNQIAEPSQDTRQQAASHDRNFSHSANLKFGRIVTALPYINWYVVNVVGSSNLPCCFLNPHGVSPIGVKTAGVMQPGTDVWIIDPTHGQYGYIIGSPPPRMSDSNLIFADWVSQASGTGFRKELYYKQLPSILREGTKGGLFNFNGGSPMDGTALGEWTQMAETGLAMHLDSFMAYMRASEMCGVWCFYHDELLRIAGRNYDLRTSGHEIIARDDEGEFQYMHGDTGYPWEATGSLKHESRNYRQTADSTVVNEATEAKFEPQHDDQMPFYRYQEYGGYLGQGRQRLVVAPPRDSGNWRYSDDDKLQGLFSEHIGYDGRYGLQTAKGFSIVKRPSIVVPKRMKQAEDASEDADTSENYKAAGKHGSGDDHKIGDIKNNGDYPQVMSVAAVLDLHAFTFNWHRLHTFHYHEKDFDTPQVSELPEVSKQQEQIQFSQLQSKMWIDRPEAKKIKIDHRYGEVEYFQNTAGITVTDDGGVVIFDGYGSAISMTGGNISISPAGTLLLQPGKSLVGLAGDDICLRSVNSVDISAGKKDVRIKAEKNLQFMSGNDGQGGMLFDCRSKGNSQQYEGKFGEDVQSSGIVFKAPDSVIAALGDNVYIRSLQGPVVIDSNKGNQNLILIGQNILNYVNKTVVHCYGIETVTGADVFGENSALLNDKLVVNGKLLIDGDIGMSGGIQAVKGFVSTNFPYVGELKDPSQLDSNIQSVQLARSGAERAAQQVRTYLLQPQYYEDQKPGSDSFRDQAQFSFRDEKQYGTEDFALPATYWQQLAAADGAGTAWQEKPVTCQSEQLLPWPGKKNWQDKSTYYNPQLLLFEVSSGNDASRPGVYEDASYGDWNKQTPSAGYLTMSFD